MANKLKKHIGLIILLIIALVFPTSLNYQARLNMRIIVTGLAIDKSGEDYQITAQIVKTSPGNETPGQSAQIEFITDKAKTLSEAVTKLAYKSGKVSAFSHTNFIVVGKSMLKEDITKSLDYFIRDKIIKNSALLLFADGSAEEEIKKTKNNELSVGLGLQKVFLFKENEGDGLMVTLIDFLIQNKMFSKSATASELTFHTNEEAKKDEASSLSSESSSSSNSSSSGGTSGQEQSEKSTSTGSSSSQGSSSGSGKEEQQYFDPEAPIVCFVDGKFVGKIEKPEDLCGYLLTNKETHKAEIMIEGVSAGRLTGDKMEVIIKQKDTKFKMSYQGNTPVFEIVVTVTKSELNEIMSDKVIASLSEEEFNATKQGLREKMTNCITGCFETTKGLGCDVFNAYELAYKKHYKKTTELFKDYSEFLENLNIKVNINIKQLDY